MGDRYCVFPPSVVEKPYEFRSGKGLVRIDQLPVFPAEILREPEQEQKSLDTAKRSRGPVTRAIRNPVSYTLRVESHEGSNGSGGLVRGLVLLDPLQKAVEEAGDLVGRRRGLGTLGGRCRHQLVVAAEGGLLVGAERVLLAVQLHEPQAARGAEPGLGKMSHETKPPGCTRAGGPPPRTDAGRSHRNFSDKLL